MTGCSKYKFVQLGEMYFILKLLLCFFCIAEILGLHVKGRLTMSGEELESLDSMQLGDAISRVSWMQTFQSFIFGRGIIFVP